MNHLLESGMLQEFSCSPDISYILKDNSAFEFTQYKVIHSQEGFVPCMKLLHNGHVQLYYLTKGLTPLTAMASEPDNPRFSTMLQNLFADMIAIRKNGFLSGGNIVLSFDKIFVDPKTLKVSLVYLPLETEEKIDFDLCEEQLRSNLNQLIGAHTVTSETLTRLSFDLANRGITFDEIYTRLGSVCAAAEEEETQDDGAKIIFGRGWGGKKEKSGFRYGDDKKAEKSHGADLEMPIKKNPAPPAGTYAPPVVTCSPTGGTFAPKPPVGGTFAPTPPMGGMTFRPAPDLAPAGPAASVRLKLMDTVGTITSLAMVVERDSFLIGSDPAATDGLIPNNSVDPAHCRIVRYGERFSVTDLGSRGGTFCNGYRLPPHTPQPLNHGDLLAIGNKQYRIVIEKEGR